MGIKIVSLNSGTTVFENESEKYFVPASNMKNFTVAAAIERLTPDFKFVTSVYAAALPDTSGVIKGDLRIYGRGDVSISTAFNGVNAPDDDLSTGGSTPDGAYYKGIDKLVDKIAAAGVKRIEGGIVGDESYFKGNAIPYTWEWSDLQWYYGAEISALPINDNAVDLSVKPGSSGGPCIVTVSPPNTIVQVVNLCSTAGGTQTLRVVKRLDRNILEVSGTMPPEDKGFTGSVTFTRPAALFVALLKQRLEAKGIVVTGGSRLLASTVTTDPAKIEITKLESPPLSVIAAKTMKPSQNMYTETILWTLGEQASRRTSPYADSSALGLAAVKGFTKQIGIPHDAVMQYDGSGLSRRDLVTPSAIAALYTFMATKSRYSSVWLNSLTIGGVDGTLGRRFRGTAAEGNIRGKSGTLDQVSALSGYVTTAGGERLAVSIIVNGVAETRDRTSLTDDIVVYLANFTGKIN
ncbi:MAG: D-alanyl-D-alanine carboxypeptidase/D-alanyl-D-alanine-endopeptidase [Pyrinomonadaceae bacterium]